MRIESCRVVLKVVGGWAQKKSRAGFDLVIVSEGGSKQVTAEVLFVSSPKRSPERAAIALHEELAITPIWRVNCQMVKSGQPTRVLIPVV
jgi:hypothetical protein